MNQQHAVNLVGGAVAKCVDKWYGDVLVEVPSPPGKLGVAPFYPTGNNPLGMPGNYYRWSFLALPWFRGIRLSATEPNQHCPNGITLAGDVFADRLPYAFARGTRCHARPCPLPAGRLVPAPAPVTIPDDARLLLDCVAMFQRRPEMRAEFLRAMAEWQ